MLCWICGSVLRCEVAALVAPKGLATAALGKAVATTLGLRLIPDFEQYVKQQRQRQHELGPASGGLSKAIQQAKGRLRAPAVVAEALRALRKPQVESVGNGVLLLDMLDSVELVSKSSSKQSSSCPCSSLPETLTMHLGEVWVVLSA
ncbi:hypothetical protein EPH_0071750 [Eimeria praecox]|uniref:Uncharacterized protein n=1 Tax=Eimeria praecox TaxID=51316 RepID=U6H3P4_9EIME|nr:hypothetical protein EPH_0071750 [Eimeria praecox]